MITLHGNAQQWITAVSLKDELMTDRIMLITGSVSVMWCNKAEVIPRNDMELHPCTARKPNPCLCSVLDLNE